MTVLIAAKGRLLHCKAHEAAAKFEFERAAEARDKIKHLRDRNLTLR
ncbi:MAG: UvrB/UvrC motif-containing protein [Acidobacteria bacterium]|nr:UvrB/UvrC motif-containing protein [Acidobacteriota bacterium]